MNFPFLENIQFIGKLFNSMNNRERTDPLLTKFGGIVVEQSIIRFTDIFLKVDINFLTQFEINWFVFSIIIKRYLSLHEDDCICYILLNQLILLQPIVKSDRM